MKKKIISALTAISLCTVFSVNVCADLAIDYVSVSDNSTISALTITSDSDTNADIFVASYQDGRLIGVSMLDDAAIPTGQHRYDIASEENADEVKVFVWDDKLQPLVKSEIYTDLLVPVPPAVTPDCVTQPPSTATPTAPVKTTEPTPDCIEPTLPAETDAPPIASSEPTASLSRIVLADGNIQLFDAEDNLLEAAAQAVVTDTGVTITAAGEYTIEGTLTEGQVAVSAATSDDKIVLNLNNVNVTNTTDDAFKGSNGKVTLVPMSDTENTFSATADSACGIYNKHDLTIKGDGKLIANSILGNGIRSKKDIEIGICDLVVNAGNNGIKGDKSVKITKNNKSVTIVSNGDGIKSDMLPESDDAGGIEGGTVTINGGVINITANSEADAETGEVSAGDGIQADLLLEIKGGTVNITADGEGLKANASTVECYTDEEAVVAEGGDGRIEISGGEININAVEDGVKATKDFIMSDGVLTIEKALDGIQTGDTVSLSATEFYSVKGSVTIDGGVINITSSEDGINTTEKFTMTAGTATINSALDGIQTGEKLTALDIGAGTDDETALYSINGTALISGGSINVTAGGGHTGNTNQEIDYSCKGIKSNYLLKITGGDITVDSLDDAVHCDNTVRISGGTLTLAADDDGVHGDSYLYISDKAYINVTASYEGIEAAEIYISGGETYVVASDDGANAAGDQPNFDAPDTDTAAEVLSAELYAGPSWGSEDTSTYGYIELTDGLLYIVAGGDGFDSNGSALVSGGILLVNGPTSGGNGVFDIGDGSYTLSLTGGTVIGAGTKDMAVTPNSTNGKAYILMGSSGSSSGGGRPGQSSSSSSGVSGSAGSVIKVADSSGNEILTYRPPVSYQWLYVMTPDMQTNTSYTVTTGGTYSGGTVDTGMNGYGIMTGGTYSGGTSTTVTSTSK